ncbi:hypothetical protein H4I95_00555 [Botrytis cinerea]
MAAFIPRASRSLATDAAASVSRFSAVSKITSLTCQSRHFSQNVRNAAVPGSSYTPRPSTATKSPTSYAAPATNPKGPENAIDSQSPIKDMTEGLADQPLILDEGARQVDWARSFHGLSSQPFSKEAADILLAPIPADDVEVKPDVSVARGEQDYFSPEGIPTATEGCKSNALMRCCKDLGVASELWDPRFIRKFMKQHAKQVWGEHVVTKKKKQLWMRKDDEVRYPYKESKFGA